MISPVIILFLKGFISTWIPGVGDWNHFNTICQQILTCMKFPGSEHYRRIIAGCSMGDAVLIINSIGSGKKWDWGFEKID